MVVSPRACLPRRQMGRWWQTASILYSIGLPLRLLLWNGPLPSHGQLGIANAFRFLHDTDGFTNSTVLPTHVDAVSTAPVVYVLCSDRTSPSRSAPNASSALGRCGRACRNGRLDGGSAPEPLELAARSAR